MDSSKCNNCGEPLDSGQYTQCPKCWLTGLLWEKFALDPVERELRDMSTTVYNEDTGYYEPGDGTPYRTIPRGEE